MRNHFFKMFILHFTLDWWLNICFFFFVYGYNDVFPMYNTELDCCWYWQLRFIVFAAEVIITKIQEEDLLREIFVVEHAASMKNWQWEKDFFFPSLNTVKKYNEGARKKKLNRLKWVSEWYFMLSFYGLKTNCALWIMVFYNTSQFPSSFSLIIKFNSLLFLFLYLCFALPYCCCV